MKKSLILLVLYLLLICCTDKNPTKLSISNEGSIEGFISIDRPAILMDAIIFIVPQNPQLNILEISPDSIGYFRQTGLVNGDYQLIVNLYSFEEYHKDFTIKGNVVNFNIMLQKKSFYFSVLPVSCEYLYRREQHGDNPDTYCGDMGERIIVIETNYRGIIKEAITNILDTTALNGWSKAGRFINTEGEIYYDEYLFKIGQDTLEIIDFGASCVRDSTDSRLLKPGLKITIKTELNGYYFNKEDPDSIDFIPFSVFCLDTTTVKEK